ncbi:MAG TPA: hypothetical protein VN894_02010 [Polyangiaceae bacterium]|nr:hypothetical protein [Polyangiaceae bacterium]
MIDFAALAATEAKRVADAEVAQPSRAASVTAPVPSQVAVAPVPPPVPTAPLPFGIDTTPKPATAAPVMPTMTLPFGAMSHTLPGVGQPAKLASPKPAAGAARLPPPQSPRVPGPVTRTPAIAAAPPGLRPPSTLSPATLSHETTRPTALAASPATTGGAGAVWIALGAGMGLGALLTTVFFQTRGVESTRSAQAAAAPLQNATALAATIPAGGGALAPPPGRDPSPSDKPPTGSAAPQGESVGMPAPAEAPAVEAFAKRTEPAGATHGPTPSPGALAPAAAASPGPGSAERGPAPATAAGRPSAPSPNDQSLEALMKRAVGIAAQPAAAPPPSPPAVVASAAPPAGDVPIKPAMGAVQGAVGTVLPATRYCLGPDDAISHATITFKSDGSVQNVAIVGPAAGQPAEACIRSRLMTARVPPFSSPTFTWTVTVRPAS